MAIGGPLDPDPCSLADLNPEPCSELQRRCYCLELELRRKNERWLEMAEMDLHELTSRSKKARRWLLEKDSEILGPDLEDLKHPFLAAVLLPPVPPLFELPKLQQIGLKKRQYSIERSKQPEKRPEQ